MVILLTIKVFYSQVKSFPGPGLGHQKRRCISFEHLTKHRVRRCKRQLMSCAACGPKGSTGRRRRRQLKGQAADISNGAGIAGHQFAVDHHRASHERDVRRVRIDAFQITHDPRPGGGRHQGHHKGRRQALGGHPDHGKGFERAQLFQFFGLKVSTGAASTHRLRRYGDGSAVPASQPQQPALGKRLLVLAECEFPTHGSLLCWLRRYEVSGRPSGCMHRAGLSRHSKRDWR